MAETEKTSFNLEQILENLKAYTAKMAIKGEALTEAQEAKYIGDELKKSTLPLAEKMVGLAKAAEEGNAVNKNILSYARNAGAEISESDEKRGDQLSKEVAELGHIFRKNLIEEAKKNATGINKLALTFKGGWEEGKHTWHKGILDFQDTVAGAADIKNLSSAFSQDMSFLSTQFSGLMSMPGMNTIVTGIKFIAAKFGMFLLPFLKKFWKWLKLWDRVKGLFIKKTPDVPGSPVKGMPLKKDGTPDMRFKANKLDKKGELGGEKESLAEATGIIPKKKGKKKLDEVTKKPKAGMGGLRKTLKAMEKPLKSLAKSVRKFIRLLKIIFSTKMIMTLQKAAMKHKKKTSMFTKALRWMGRGMGKMVKGMMKVAKRLIIVIGQFLVQVAIFTAGLIGAIVGFIIANLPIIAIILLIVLVVVGLVLLFKLVMDNWEKIKVKMAMAMDRLGLVGAKMKNWFSDAAGNISYTIQLLIAKVKDGFVSMANNIIEKVNNWLPPNWKLGKMEGGGNVAGLQTERAKELTRREERDRKLQADFDAKHAERGKELEGAAKLDADRKAKKAAGVSEGQIINTSISTDNREISLSAEGTRPTDSQTLVAIHTGQ